MTTLERSAQTESRDLAPSELPLRGQVIRFRGFSVRLDLRAVAVCAVVGGLIVAVGLWSISVGDFPIPISDVIATLLGNPTEDSEFIAPPLDMTLESTEGHSFIAPVGGRDRGDSATFITSLIPKKYQCLVFW